MGEPIVHREDIRGPFGIAHDYPACALTRVADFYQKSDLLIGGKKRVAGLTLRATDADWTAGTHTMICAFNDEIDLPFTTMGAEVKYLPFSRLGIDRHRPT